MLITQLVNNQETRKEFLEFPVKLYAKDNQYIRPLDKDIEDIFNPKKNKFFKKGICERYIFRNAKKQTVGKIAVFIHQEYAQQQPTGGIGFFDCINDQLVANFIFDFAKQWLQKHNIEAMDGPINFGERDKFWGLLVEGFHEPLYNMNYNFPYYQKLFEDYGFRPYFQQLCYSREIHSQVARVFTTMHAKHVRNPAISAKRMTRNNLKSFAKDFTEIYNKAWAKHGEGKQLEVAKTYQMFRKLKPILNDHISWFVYENQKPIAMWMNIPDVNQWFKYMNGKFGWIQKLKFLWLKKMKKNKKMIGLVFGVIPEWQQSGIDGYMIWEGTQHLRKKTDFEVTELQWIGDFNPKMMKIAEHLDTQITRKLITYRYLFDRTKKFEKHPII